MKTNHRFLTQDSRERGDIGTGEVDLVITSPPYPMIEMWDSVFGSFNESITDAIEDGDGKKAFQLIHKELDKVWENIDEYCNEGATICINIGDATRKIGGEFNLFPNHSRIIEKFRSMGYSNLPNILWKKPTNSTAKFMGSGMIPPNAYVTLEHEHILIFRKNGTRSIENNDARYESAYFWEERNKWFSDTWSDIVGISQELQNSESRETAAAYPLEIPLRIIRMYSIHGDTVLDPFLGTGTTSLAAALTARNSIGIDIDLELVNMAKKRFENSEEMSKKLTQKRLQKHLKFEKDEGGLNYQAENYGFTVTTKQEKKIQPKIIKSKSWNENVLEITHEPFPEKLI